MRTLELIAKTCRLRLRTAAGVRLRWGGLGGALLVPALCGQVAMAAPRIPVAPVIVWSEDFENPQTPPIATEGRDLLAYQGAAPAGQMYTADSLYQMSANQCNGIVTSFNQDPTSATMSAACGSQGNWNSLQQMAEVAGRYQGQSAADAVKNHVMAMLTANGTYPAGAIAFRTKANIPQSSDSRFLTARADVVANFCSSGFVAPLLRFSLVNDANAELPISMNAVDPCVDGVSFNTIPIGIGIIQTAKAQTVTSPGALLFSGNSVGFVLRNEQTSSMGNDSSIDNAQIIDVTPQLDKAFSPASIQLGQVSRLTMTITNTTDLLRKQGWSFTDNLPAGLVVEGNASTTCPGTNVQAAAGGSTVTVSNGDLAQGAAFCEVSLDVRPTATGSFTNGPSNLSLIGLNQPATLVVLAVEPTADMQATSITLPTTMTVGAPVSGSFSCTNAGPSEATAASCVIAGLPAGATTSCTPSVPTGSPLASGSVIDCTVAFTPTAGGIFTALVTAGSGTPDPMPANNTTSRSYSVGERADMQASAITLPATMTVGAPVSGSFSCTNAGPSEALAASCVISGLPAGATTSCTPSVPTASPLASGGSIACTVQFTPTTTGTIAALVTASSSTVDPVPANNTKAHPFNPVERADMQATSVTLPATANVGVPVKGSFVCTNAGPNAAAFANCSIAGLPADASTSCTPAVPTGTPLASGASIACTVSFTPTTQGSLTATVTAVSGTTDPEPANNSRDQELVVAAALAPEPVPATGVPALVLMGLAVMLAGLGTQRGRVRR
ncbi:hypothetical protein N5K37_15935 [Delftia tsuruhatensis]|uniref:DUF7933 domain-containing protein n=1 Tax=Delftia tsuruhatensis TaxID=180282 RepID=UPI000A6E39AD|nr:hypothetical protein [Delftia tsuruhatensis]MDH2231387.1 hypothetical protein [Delftia tsuruhatensis]